jgi:hypothetical protein
MKKFKEYYKRKLFESLTTELSSQETPIVQSQQPTNKEPNQYVTQTQPYNNVSMRTSGTGFVTPPIGFEPPDDNWPPIPGNPLPTYVHPDGSQVWVIPGPPTSIYTIRPNPFYNPNYPFGAPFIYEMTINQSDYPGLHQIQNPYHNWQWNPANRQWVKTTPGQRLDNDGNIVPGGLRLWEIWPGWQQPDMLPPSRKGQEGMGEWNQGGQEWDIVPGYNNEYAPGYYPNYVISPTNQPNM